MLAAASLLRTVRRRLSGWPAQSCVAAGRAKENNKPPTTKPLPKHRPRRAAKPETQRAKSCWCPPPASCGARCRVASRWQLAAVRPNSGQRVRCARPRRRRSRLAFTRRSEPGETTTLASDTAPTRGAGSSSRCAASRLGSHGRLSATAPLAPSTVAASCTAAGGRQGDRHGAQKRPPVTAGLP